VFASKARSGLTPLRYGFGGRGSAVSGLRSLSRLWEGGSAFALCAGGLVFASKARSGPTPLRYGLVGGAPRYQASARWVGSENDELSRFARGGLVFASKARSGLTPLRSGFWWPPRCRVDRFRSAPTGHCIPARGGTPGKAKPEPMRSEGTPHNGAPRYQASARWVGSENDELSRFALGVRCSPPRLAPARHRSAAVWWAGLRGIRPPLAE
jgi:hypothetical protein